MYIIKCMLLAVLLGLPSSVLAGSSLVGPEAGGTQWTYKKANVDALIKTGAGVIHTVTCTGVDATAVAGSIIIYDNTAESGTDIFFYAVPAATVAPFTVTLDYAFTTGLYIGYTTTNDVYCYISWR